MGDSKEKEMGTTDRDMPHPLGKDQPSEMQHQDSAPPAVTQETETNALINEDARQTLKQDSVASLPVENGKGSANTHIEQQEPQPSSLANPGAHEIPREETVANNENPVSETLHKPVELASDAKPTERGILAQCAEPILNTVSQVCDSKPDVDGHKIPTVHDEHVMVHAGTFDSKAESVETKEELKNKVEEIEEDNETKANEAVAQNETKANEAVVQNETKANEAVVQNETKANAAGEENETKADEAVEENKTKANEAVEENETKANETVGENETKANETDIDIPADNDKSGSKHSFLLDDDHMYDGSASGTEENQSLFMKELENFFRERGMDFKPPKFYGEGLNCLKLWRAVMRLGGYDKVTSCKLWRQVGESFRPPKTCTTVSWTFRGFYEKALLDYERHKTNGGELGVPAASPSEPALENQGSGSGRARRDAAARAMQGWHSQRLLGNGEVSDPIIKDKNSMSLQKREKQLKNIGLLKRKKPSYEEQVVKASRTKTSKPQLDIAVVDIGPPADWVKINVQRTKDCFEVYALVPGLLREEVRVQSDPAGRLVISGDPEHPDNPWGVTPFKKVVSLPSRIDPHQTSAVVTLHGQLFVRVPFEQSD